MSHQLNQSAKKYLKANVIDDFVLNKEGIWKVIESNQSVTSNHFSNYVYGISKLWYKRTKEALDFMLPEEFETALDVCCGTGPISLNCMHNKMFKKMYAVDINKNAIKILIDQIEKYDIKNLVPINMDVMNTDFRSTTFDCVLGHSFLHHLPDNQAFLSEMHRILKSGGVLCLTHEPTISAGYLEGFIGRLIKNLFKLKKRSDAQWLGDVWVYNEKELYGMLNKTGYQEVKIIASGKLSTIIGSFVERSWIRLFKKNPPNMVFKIRDVFSCLDSLLFKKNDKDSFSRFTILARK